ncbi:MAG: DUF6622 family protein [Arcobacter sp.]|uniref:DUF6622 family protein n=1 Tax=Arcobacter sp. TaxID=1872629 RepID=UPI003B00776F
MILEIIKDTPIWVFILFISLLFLGYTQTKDRKVKLKRIFILPTAMILLSLFGIFSAFGTVITALVLWFISGFIFLLIGLKLSFPKNIKYNVSEDVFYVSGSWIPMILILIIFCIKYFVGVAIARELPIINELEFIMSVSFLYGSLSGIFLSRSIVIMQSKIYNKSLERNI